MNADDTARAPTHICVSIQRLAPIANGLLLLAFVVCVVLVDGSRNVINDWATFPSDQPTPIAEAVRSQWLRNLIGGATAITLLTMLVGLVFGPKRSRSLRAWLVFVFLVCGWLAAWLARHDLYWYGHALRVATEVSSATELAISLDNEWPVGDGDYPALGFVLGYPKHAPTTLMLAGEPCKVGRLRIVAIEKSKDDHTLRFQLANPNHDTWLVRTNQPETLGQFTNGFDVRFEASRRRELAGGWYLVRYATE